uniref:Serine/threonine-protein kinase Kist n=1 Tax=Scolopendra viridis TaxID=118503 RepID=A0A4D5R9F1_SCOVI
MSLESERPKFENGQKIIEPTGNVYEIIKKLGEGRCAVVYEAFDVTNKKHIALKVYNSGLRYEGAFQRELTVLETLQSLSKKVNAVELYGTFQTIHHHYVILELLECNLRQILFKNNKQGFSLWGIQKFAKDIFSGLAVLHSQQMVHADLKPANIHWCPQHGCYKLLDFGLSFHLTEEDIHQVQSMGYQAPEVYIWNRYKQQKLCNGCEDFSTSCFEETLDHRKNVWKSSLKKGKSKTTASKQQESSKKCFKPSLAIDVWSVGCLLMEVTTGRKFLKDNSFYHKMTPFESNIHNMIDNQLAEVWDHYQRDGLEVATCFQLLKDLIYKCFDMNPAHRLTSEAALHHPFLQLQLEPLLTDCFILTSKVLLLMNIADPTKGENTHQDKDVSDILEECSRKGPVLQTFLSLNGSLTGSVLINYKYFRDCQQAVHRLKSCVINGHNVVAAFYPLELFEKLNRA